jgi:hypothetical protein
MRTVSARQEHGLVGVNQIRSHCLIQLGMTVQIYSDTTRSAQSVHGRNTVLCVNQIRSTV